MCVVMCVMTPFLPRTYPGRRRESQPAGRVISPVAETLKIYYSPRSCSQCGQGTIVCQ